MKILTIVACLLFTSAVYSAEDAMTVINQMIDQYSQLQEYRDNGISKDIRTSVNGEISEEDITEFETKYKRGGKFNLTWRVLPDDLMKQIGMGAEEHAFWINESGIFTKSHYDTKATRHTNINDALSSVWGMFNEIAILTPEFLIDNSSCKPNLGATSSVITESSNSEVTIKLVNPKLDDRYITIDTKTNMLKRYEYQYTQDSGDILKRVIEFNVENSH